MSEVLTKELRLFADTTSDGTAFAMTLDEARAVVAEITKLRAQVEAMRPVVEAALKMDFAIYGEPCENPEECDEPDFCRLHSPLAIAVNAYRAQGSGQPDLKGGESGRHEA